MKSLNHYISSHFMGVMSVKAISNSLFGVVLLIGLFAFTPIKAQTISGEGTAENPYQIGSVSDWDAFSKIVETANGKYLYVKLTKDVGPVSTIVGTTNPPAEEVENVTNYFSGTFDGDGHTLTIDYNPPALSGDKQKDAGLYTSYLGIFSFVKDATFKNLNVTGTFNTTAGVNGGLVGVSKNAIRFDNCQSDVTINPLDNGDYALPYYGGFVGMIALGATEASVFNDCSYTGKICYKGDPDGGFCGFVGTPGLAEFHNCFSSPTFVLSENVQTSMDKVEVYPFAQGGNDNDIQSFDNCYFYYKDNGNNISVEVKPQGSAVTEEQLSSGEVAWNLQRQREAQVWGEDIAPGNHPILTKVSSERVWRALYKYYNSLAATPDWEQKGVSYANQGKPFSTPKDIDAATYEVMYDADKEPATADRDIILMLIDRDYTIIACKQDWDNFATYYRGGTGKYRMIRDVLDPVDLMAGSDAIPFRGTFDGEGHTLVINYDFQDGVIRGVAPFRRINGATIMNVRVKGKIITNTPGVSNGAGHGGIVGYALGTSRIDDCESAVDITYNGTDDGTSGGMVGRVFGNLTINNCAFTGTATYKQGSSFGGLIGWVNDGGHASMNNCLVAANIDVQAGGYNGTFARRAGGYDMVNCYYLPFENIYYPDGTSVTAAQLKSGEIAFKLQSTQPSLHWGQTLSDGTPDVLPQLTSNEERRVQENVYDGADDPKVYDNYVVFDDSKGNIANIQSHDNNTYKVKVSRAIVNGYNSLVLPFSLSAAEVGQYFGSDAKVYRFSNPTGQEIHLDQGQGNDIPVNTPVIIKATVPAQTATIEMKFPSKQVAYGGTTIRGAGDVDFVGSYAKGQTPGDGVSGNGIVKEGDGFLNGNKFYTSKGETRIRATRAYFTKTRVYSAKLSLRIDGEPFADATGIDSVNGHASVAGGAVYNLEGQKIADSLDEAVRNNSVAPGVYIVGNKKMLIK